MDILLGVVTSIVVTGHNCGDLHFVCNMQNKFMQYALFCLDFIYILSLLSPATLFLWSFLDFLTLLVFASKFGNSSKTWLGLVWVILPCVIWAYATWLSCPKKYG